MMPSIRPSRARALLAWFTAASTLALVLSGCGDTPDHHADPSTPSSAATPAIPVSAEPVDYQDSVAQIPLDGRRGSSITWRLDQAETPSEQAVVTAVQYNLALNVAVESTNDRSSLAPLYGAVSTGGQLLTRYAAVRDDRVAHVVGPRRYWLSKPHTFDDTFERDPDHVREVEVCQNLTSTKSADSTTKPRTDEVMVSTYQVAEVVDQSVRRWKVYRVASKGVHPPYRSAWERQCAAWAGQAPSDK